MRKKLSIVLISSMALLLSTGCSSTKTNTAANGYESSENVAKAVLSFKVNIKSSLKVCSIAKKLKKE